MPKLVSEVHVMQIRNARFAASNFLAQPRSAKGALLAGLAAFICTLTPVRAAVMPSIATR